MTVKFAFAFESMLENKFTRSNAKCCKKQKRKIDFHIFQLYKTASMNNIIQTTKPHIILQLFCPKNLVVNLCFFYYHILRRLAFCRKTQSKLAVYDKNNKKLSVTFQHTL